MGAHTTMLHVRVDNETKEQATEALEAMGLTVADAVRILLKRVAVDQAFPLELKVPNATTRAAMAEADEIIRNGRLRFSTAEEMFEALEKESTQLGQEREKPARRTSRTR